jgi:hypothetical protein
MRSLLVWACAGVRIVDDEQFGPVMPMVTCSDNDEVIHGASSTMFGLGWSVVGTDVAAANAGAGGHRVGEPTLRPDRRSLWSVQVVWDRSAVLSSAVLLFLNGARLLGFHACGLAVANDHSGVLCRGLAVANDHSGVLYRGLALANDHSGVLYRGSHFDVCRANDGADRRREAPEQRVLGFLLQPTTNAVSKREAGVLSSWSNNHQSESECRGGWEKVSRASFRVLFEPFLGPFAGAPRSTRVGGERCFNTWWDENRCADYIDGGRCGYLLKNRPRARQVRRGSVL